MVGFAALDPPYGNVMSTQDHFWSHAARSYERVFINPYVADVRGNPLKSILHRLRNRKSGVVADLGCGIGPLLPFLSRRFKTVHAVDFAAGMLERARAKSKACKNIRFHQASFLDLRALKDPIDVAVAVNSLVLPNVVDLEKALGEIRRVLKPDGIFLGILPAIDAVHYYTMLLLDRALAAGKPMEVARKNAAHHAEHALYDFAFGEFHYEGLHQHFWQPYEIHHRFARAGFALKRLKKVHLSWKQFAGGRELKDHPAPWDWFFLAKVAGDSSRHAAGSSE